MMQKFSIRTFERLQMYVEENAELANVDSKHGVKMTKVAYNLSQCPATGTVYFNIRFRVSSRE